jgi:hypothetical protein
MKRRASGNLSAAMESAAGGSGSAAAASAAAAPQEVRLHSFDILTADRCSRMQHVGAVQPNHDSSTALIQVLL